MKSEEKIKESKLNTNEDKAETDDEVFKVISTIVQWYLVLDQVIYTAKLKPIWTVGSGFSSISPSNLDQISKSGTVLKS